MAIHSPVSGFPELYKIRDAAARKAITWLRRRMFQTSSDVSNYYLPTEGGTITGSLDIAGTLDVDTIDEYTPAAGVTIEGVLLKDGNIVMTDTNFPASPSWIGLGAPGSPSITFHDSGEGWAANLVRVAPRLYVGTSPALSAAAVADDLLIGTTATSHGMTIFSDVGAYTTSIHFKNRTEGVVGKIYYANLWHAFVLENPGGIGNFYFDKFGKFCIGVRPDAANTGQNCLAIGGSTAPGTINTADTIIMYEADSAGAGTACPYFRTENGTVIGLNQSLLTTDVIQGANAVDLNDLVNLNTLLDHTGIVANYWLGNTTLDLMLTDSEDSFTEVTNAENDELSNFYFKSSVAETPAPFLIKAGTIIGIHWTGDETLAAGRNVGLYLQLGYVNADGTTTFIQIGANSDTSDALTNVKTAFTSHIHVATDTIVPAGKRLWLKVFSVTVSGGGGYPTIRMYFDNSVHHMTFDVAGSVLGSFVKRDGSSVYTATGAGFKDEDNMTSDSAVATASQQSIKAFGEGLIGTHEATYNHGNYDTAYGWGDHASGGYAVAAHAMSTHSDDDTYNISTSGSAAIGGGMVLQDDKIVVCATYTDEGINAAIDQLGAEGGLGIFPEGTYTVDAVNTVDAANTWLRGTGWGTILDASGGQTFHVINLNATDYGRVSDLKILGAAGLGGTGDLIYGSGSTEWSLDGLYLADSDDMAIYLLNCDETRISNSTIAGSDSTGVYCNSSEGVMVENCRLFRNIDGIYFTSASYYCGVVGCDIEDNDRHGVYLNTNQNFVAACLLRNNDYSGVRIGSGGMNSIFGNQFYNNAQYNIYADCDGNTIAANRFSYAVQRHIYLTSAEDNAIVANTFYRAGNNYNDVSLVGGSHYNLVGMNQHEGVANYGERAVYIDDSNYNLVIGVLSRLHDTCDIGLDGTSDHNILFGNHLQSATRIIDNSSGTHNIIWDFDTANMDVSINTDITLTTGKALKFADGGSAALITTTVGNPGSDATLVSEQGIREALIALGAAAHNMASHTDDDTYNISTSGSLTIGGSTRLGNTINQDTVGINVAPESESLLKGSFAVVGSGDTFYYNNEVFTHTEDDSTANTQIYGTHALMQINDDLSVNGTWTAIGHRMQLESSLTTFSGVDNPVAYLIGYSAEVDWAAAALAGATYGAIVVGYKANVSGNLGTTGNTIKWGADISVTESAVTNYGGRFTAQGAVTNYGLWAYATGAHTTNYGLYGYAAGATTNWGLYVAAGSSHLAGTVNLGTVANAGVDTDKFLVLDAAGNVDFRTGAEVADDIGAGGGAWTQIAEIEVGAGGAASIDFTSISGSYTHLVIIGSLRSETAATFDRLDMRFNNDSTAIYDEMKVIWQGTTGTTRYCVVNQTAGEIAWIDDNGGEANAFAGIWIMIPNYANTNMNKRAQSRSEMVRANAGTSDPHLINGFVNWSSTAAIARVTFQTDGGDDLAEHSKLTLWGIT